MPNESATLADRYVLESPLARGGMGQVWRARDEVLARHVAVKILHARLAGDPELVERFRREAMAAAKLTHPNIVAIYDTGAEQGPGGAARHFIVMEFCPGGTLADMLRDEGALSPERVVAVGRAVCAALGYAHRYGIVHRDVKPGNVLLTGDGSVKVGDFGIAKAAFTGAPDLTTSGSILGTVAYLSPEQAEGKEPDARSDLYSLGVVLYELVTGRPPFHAESQVATAMMHVRERPPAPRSIRAGIPRSLESVILRALEKDRDARYQSAAEMRAALEAALGGAGETMALPAAAAPSPASGAGVGPDTKWIVPVLVLVVLAVAAALLLPSLVSSPDEEGRANGGGQREETGGALDIAAVRDFDPDGDGSEHPDEVGLAVDGDPGTAWSTESYDASFELIGKGGVGLVFDLGEPFDVSQVRVTGSAGALEIRAADAEADDESAFDVAASTAGVSGDTAIDVSGTTARYWLLWITELPGGSGEAQIVEVEFRGS